MISHIYQIYIKNREVEIMEEKILKAKKGMPMLFLFILLYAIAIGLIILGGP